MSVTAEEFRASPDLFAETGALGRLCRFGLATRGNTSLEADAVLEAVERGVNYLNWCEHADGLQAAVRQLGKRRQSVCLAVQLSARSADGARKELDGFLQALDTDYVDVVTYYYVEHLQEWEQILARGGAAETLEASRSAGQIRAIGLTSHQRPLAARAAASGRLDLLMTRYNAAHRGAEKDVFPVTTEHNISVVAFTCLRWGALLESTPDDPHRFRVPAAADWYRFVLCHPAVTVALMAPNGIGEFRQNLKLLDDWRGCSSDEYASLKAHGDRVHRHGGSFP